LALLEPATNDDSGDAHVAEVTDDNKNQQIAEPVDQANNQLSNKIGKYLVILCNCIAF